MHTYMDNQFTTKEPRIYNGKSTESSIVLLGKLDSSMQKNETGPNLHHTQKLNQNESKTLM